MRDMLKGGGRTTYPSQKEPSEQGGGGWALSYPVDKGGGKTSLKSISIEETGRHTSIGKKKKNSNVDHGQPSKEAEGGSARKGFREDLEKKRAQFPSRRSSLSGEEKR